jgi:glucose-6-phosphate isomerase
MLSTMLDGRGVDPESLSGERSERFGRVREGVLQRREAGELGFMELPFHRDAAAAVQEVADGFGQWFETIVVLGIGGSALGTRTLRDALLGPRWNELTAEDREYFPRLFVLDNPDPASAGDLLDRLDPRTTLFNVVSKSGATAETMALYLVVADRLRKVLDPESVRGHLIFTTDPERGALRRLADQEGIPSLEIPPNVGGRFSVLSAAGLLPAAVTGIDAVELLEGAAAMGEACLNPDLMSNPAGLLATLLHAADTEQGAGIHVLMPYADRLRSLGLWFQQLWAESLGKREDVGPTPLPALGTVDQHAQVQLFMEGPRDKVVMFVQVEDADEDPMTLPVVHPGVPELAYLGGHTMKGLLEAERRATAEALRRGGRPNLTIQVPRLTAHTMGELFMLFEMATVFAGEFYGVNPLDQPGVELGKHLTYGLLGREGFEAPEFPDPSSSWRV